MREDGAPFLLAVVLFFWWVIASARGSDRLDRWYVQHSGNRASRMAALVAVTQTAWLGIWGVAWVIGDAIADAAGTRAAAGWLVVPLLVVYLPFVGCFMPGGVVGYQLNREKAERNGASRSAARAMFWTGGPFAVVGMGISCAAYSVCFFL